MHWTLFIAGSMRSTAAQPLLNQIELVDPPAWFWDYLTRYRFLEMIFVVTLCLTLMATMVGAVRRLLRALGFEETIWIKQAYVYRQKAKAKRLREESIVYKIHHLEQRYKQIATTKQPPL